MQKKIKWGILGTSYISEVMARAIEESSISELIAIGSRSFIKGKQFCNQFNISKHYEDYHLLLKDDEIDVVYIGLPNHLHKDWIIHAAKAGKHILCEKPFVLSIQEAQEVVSVLNETNILCMEALMYRCHPLTHKLKELIQTNVLGDIKLYNALYTANIADIANPISGGSIRNLGCYPISLIRLLTNAEPLHLYGSGRMNKQNTSDNQANGILKFANGIIAMVSTADDMDMHWQFDVYGTEGNLKMITNPWLPDRENKLILHRHNQNPIEIQVAAEKSLYTYQIDTISSSILEHNNTVIDGVSLQDSLGNIAVLENWLQQIY